MTDIHIMCHYDEIGLKGKNRSWFERKLQQNMRFALDRIGGKVKIKSFRGRILTTISGDADWTTIMSRLQKVCGIAYFARAYFALPSLQELQSSLAKYLPDLSADTFAVRVKREDKNFPLNSPQIEREIGAFVAEATGWKVNLGNPELTLSIEWLHDGVWFYFQREKGPGGLPVGISGKVLCLISGGIDSPVAAYLMMKRACLVEFVHFHSFPFTDSASQKKVCDLVETLCQHRCPTRLHMVPFSETQQEIVTMAPSSCRIILYRRFMLRIAQEIATREKLLALVTGDSLAQVASQTLDNMVTIDSAVQIPVLRPLIGMDKREIIDLAKEIGTFPLSIKPHDDCCSWLMPKKPELYSTPAGMLKIEENLEVDELVQKNLSQVSLQKF